MISNQAEQRRDQAVSNISKSHLDSDHGLGTVRPKKGRGRMDNGRINGRTAKTQQQKPQTHRQRSQVQKDYQDSQ